MERGREKMSERVGGTKRLRRRGKERKSYRHKGQLSGRERRGRWKQVRTKR